MPNLNAFITSSTRSLNNTDNPPESLGPHIRSVTLALIEEQLHHNLRAFQLRMLHDHLHRPAHRATRHAPIIQHLHLPPRDDLAQTAVLCVADLHKVGIEEEDVGPVEGGGLGFAHEFHDDAPADVAVLVDVDGAFFVAEDELGVGESEHAKRVLSLEALCDGGNVLLFEFGDGPWLLLIQGEDFKAFGRANREGGMEEVDPIAICRNVELVVVPEELGCATLEHPRLLLRSFLVNRLQHFEGRR